MPAISDWILWIAAAGILVIMEIFTGTFYLLMLAIGLVAGALAAFAGASGPLQLFCAAAVGAASTLLLRASRFGKMDRHDASRDPNVNLDIGQTLHVPEWRAVSGDRPSARVMYRGALWDVELASGAPHPGTYRIREVRGSRLIVAEIPAHQ